LYALQFYELSKNILFQLFSKQIITYIRERYVLQLVPYTELRLYLFW